MDNMRRLHEPSRKIPLGGDREGGRGQEEVKHTVGGKRGLVVSKKKATYTGEKSS